MALPDDFAARIAPYRAELHAYCYRMLGSLHDAEDALQEALLNAWRGLEGFEGRGSLRAWLYRIATRACLDMIEQRARRALPDERAARALGVELEAMVEGPLWLEPYPDPVDESAQLRESVELAFVAALQHLPANQRAALILREVLGFSAAEVAALLETTVASINSALQRARETVDGRVPPMTQQATRKSLGIEGERALVAAYVSAWEAGDVDGIVKLLARDAKFTMPPIPTWFSGADSIGGFFAERIFVTPWRLVPARASGQIAFLCYQGPRFTVGALNVVTLRGELIGELTGFLDPAVHARFLPAER
jgi:RNA polymerase sigma-70 factor (ECF subfamily)